MKKRELYQGKSPYSYIAFDPIDSVIVDEMLEILEQEGYRFWLNEKITPDESDFAEIGKKLGSSSATILVLTENAVVNGLVNAVVESTVERRNPLVIYMTYENAELLAYLHNLFDKAVNVVILRTWEQSFLSSNSVRQALSATKGLTYAQEEELYSMGMEILSSDTATREQMSDAMKSISFSASNEFPPALNFLGNLALERARAGSDSYSSAVVYYKVAAEKGDIDSIYKLGCLISDGEGFAKNNSAALPFLAIAAVQGIADAQYRIAEMMEYGLGVTQNRNEATKWYIKALENGDRRPYIKLAHRYLNGETVEKNESTAADYYIEAAKDGLEEAYLVLAKLYRDGIGVRVNEEKSQEYFFLAADKGIYEAQYNYGMCLYKDKKYVEAFKWLMLSVSDLPDGATPEPDALYAIAECCEKGLGTAQDRTKAFLYYYSAAKLGHTRSRLALAECYKKGIGVPINKRAAAFYDTKEADSDGEDTL